MPALDRLLRGLLLASDGPLSVQSVVDLIQKAVDEEEWPEPESEASIIGRLEHLQKEWNGENGLELVSSEAGWRLRTATDLAPLIRRLWPERVVRLSRAALEALAVVAYRQPCTRAEVEDARGVDCGGVFRSLLDRKLIRIIGRKDEPGRPLLYSTTPDFLETFSLESLRELPTLRDLERLAAEESIAEKGVVPDRPEVPVGHPNARTIDTEED